MIPIGVLVEYKKLGYTLITQKYNESSNTYHCTSKDGSMYLGCFRRDELMIIKE